MGVIDEINRAVYEPDPETWEQIQVSIALDRIQIKLDEGDSLTEEEEALWADYE